MLPRAAGAAAGDNPEQAFRDFAHDNGVILPQKLAFGKIQRFDPEDGGRKNDKGWCVFRGVFGKFGIWGTDIEEGVNWFARKGNGAGFTEAERQARKKQSDDAQRQYEQEKRRQHKKVAEATSKLIRESEPAPDSHPYLLNKQVGAHGLRVHKDHPGKLIMPLMDVHGIVWSYQTIDESGEKRFPPGGRKDELFFPIGGLPFRKPHEIANYIGEGFATMAGCQAKYLMVLEGDQDQGKSKGLAALCPDQDWFTDNFSLERDTDPKKVIEQTRGKLIVEISELDIRRGDAERIKGMLSRNVDEGRPAYARHEIAVPRAFIFIGTCNELMLIDTTGNVRFWPIECKGGEIDVEAIKRDRDQLWAEHAYYEAKGEAIHLTKGEDDKAAAQDIAAARLQRETGDEIQNCIAAWAITDYTGGGIPLRKIAKEALGIETENLDRAREMRIGSALRKAGFERHKSMGLITWSREKPS